MANLTSTATMDMLDKIPGLQPPPGHHSDFQHPEARQPTFIMTAVCLTISTVAVALRISRKVQVLRSVQLEDYILLFSQISFACFCGVSMYLNSLGEGLHQWDVPMSHLLRLKNISNIAEMLYVPAILSAKVAMLLQMRRLFTISKARVLFRLHDILLWLNVLFYIAMFLTVTLACIPREKLWNPFVPGHCISLSASILSSSVLNIVSDLTMLILPLVIILRLHMPQKTTLYLYAMLGGIFLGFVLGIVRLVFGVILIRTDDATWAMEPVGRWAIAEISTVILASSIPLMTGIVKYTQGQDPSQSWFKWKQSIFKSNGQSLPSFVVRKDDTQVNVVNLERGNNDSEETLELEHRDSRTDSQASRSGTPM